jgi:hypothetical protein
LLLVYLLHREVGMHIAVGTDLEKGDGQQLLHLRIWARHPPAGHKKSGRYLVRNQVFDQLAIKSRAHADGTEIIGQSDRGAGSGAAPDDLRRCWLAITDSHRHCA